jgi:Tfp pilus assembly protein PilW
MRLTTKSKTGSTVGVKPATLVLGLLVTTLLGCGKAGENKPASPGGPAPATQSSPQTESAAPAAAPAAPAAVVIATADGEKAGTRVDITELKRASDNTLTLKFAMVNDSAETLVFNYNYGDPQYSTIDFNTIAGVTLVDGTNKKKYFVVRDTENTCLCSRGLKDIPAKSRGNVWAKFPAPPDDVQKISIVIPHFGPIDDVAISR